MARAPRICLIGSTGSGKSTLGNVLMGLDINGLDDKNKLVGFGVEASADICTTVTTMQAKHWLGDPDLPMVEIIDTPGHGGGGDKAEDYRQAMVDFIRSQEYIDAIVCVRNSQQPRFDAHDVEAFRVFSEMFGQENFFQNLIFVFSRWSFSPAEATQRAKSGVTLEKLTSNLREQMESRYPGLSTKIPIMALDALYWPNDEQERNVFLSVAGQVWHIVSEYSKRPLMVRGMRMVEDQDKKLERNIVALKQMESTIEKKHEQETLAQQQCLEQLEQRNAAMMSKLAANHRGAAGFGRKLYNAASKMWEGGSSSSPPLGNCPMSGDHRGTLVEPFHLPQLSLEYMHRAQPSSPFSPDATGKPPLSTYGLTASHISSGNGPDGDQASAARMKHGPNNYMLGDTAMDSSPSAGPLSKNNGTNTHQTPTAVYRDDTTNARNLATLQHSIKEDEECIAKLKSRVRWSQDELKDRQDSLAKKQAILASLSANHSFL